MNGRTAKKIRKKVYGSAFSPKQRDYERKAFGMPIIATGLRRVYKDAKRDYYKREQL